MSFPTYTANLTCFSVLIRYKSTSDDFYQTILSLVGIPAFLQPILLPLFRAIFSKKIYLKSKMAIGDFEQQDFDEILHRDLQVIQDYLGEQKFLFGDKITPVSDYVQIFKLFSFPGWCHRFRTFGECLLSIPLLDRRCARERLSEDSGVHGTSPQGGLSQRLYSLICICNLWTYVYMKNMNWW